MATASASPFAGERAPPDSLNLRLGEPGVRIAGVAMHALDLSASDPRAG